MKNFKKILLSTSVVALLLCSDCQTFAICQNGVNNIKYANAYIKVIKNIDCKDQEQINKIIDQIIKDYICEENSGDSNNDQSNSDSEIGIPEQSVPDNDEIDQEDDNQNSSTPDIENPSINVPDNEGSNQEDDDSQSNNTPDVEIPEQNIPGNDGDNQDQDSDSQIDSELQKLANEVVNLVNIERSANGLKALEIDLGVQTSAQVRAEEIETVFSHTRPNGTSCFTVLKENGVSYKGAGENIASGQTTAKQVMNSWMNSEGHRTNILNSKFTKIGVGVHKTSSGKYYWTQMFIS